MARDSDVVAITMKWASSPSADANLNVRPGEAVLVFEDGYEEHYSLNDGSKPTRAQFNYFFRALTGFIREGNTKGILLDWDASIAYTHTAYVTGSNGIPYMSVQGSTNVDPTTDADSSHWTRLVPVQVATPSASESTSGVVRYGTDSDQQTGTATNRVLSIKRIVDLINRLIPSSRLLPSNDGASGTFLGHDKTFRTLPTATDATDSVKGVVELSDQSQADTGTDTATAMTPALVKRVADARAAAATVPPSRQLPAANGASGTFLGHDKTFRALPSASTAIAGVSELAIEQEVTDGVTNRVVTPSVLPIRQLITYTSGSTPTAANKANTLHLVER